MNAPNDLTICTVSFHSKSWLDLNWDLTLRLNDPSQVNWIVAENSPVHSPQRLSCHDARFEVVEGAGFEPMRHAEGSYHHGMGMNKLLKSIESRFALFLDPDFFILRPKWIADVIAHMTNNDIAIFGAPWHPRWYRKTRYFPCVHCMFVDLMKVPKESLDFLPDYEGLPGYEKDPEGNTLAAKSRSVRRLIRALDPVDFRKRRYIGTSRDVSWRIYDRYSADPGVKADCLKPVFHPAEAGFSKLLEKCFPDRLSFIPKVPDSFTEYGFKERNLPDLDGSAWEEFTWKGEPFGFHVRSTPKTASAENMKLHHSKLKEFLEFWAPEDAVYGLGAKQAS